MAVICPTVTARDAHEYQTQMNRISGFASRVHIDLTDGVLAGVPLVALEQIWWPDNITADIHLMFKDPSSVLSEVIRMKPHMAIVHAEADGNFLKIADALHKAGIKVGVALQPRTSTHILKPSLSEIDHVLIFSGDLGHFGGIADLELLNKITQLKEWKKDLEFGWDGGINDENVRNLILGGVDVLNVGGYIQRAVEPKEQYVKLAELIA